jgi:aminoglycoside phosphotransferase (APT) family kinase protein
MTEDERHEPNPTSGQGREYSNRLGVISDAQLQAACDRFELGRLVAAEAAPGGLFGQNIMLSTTSGEWVLRGAPHHEWQFAWERYFSRIIHERTRAEAPWPHHIEESPGIFGWMFAVVPRLRGTSIQAAQSELTDADRLELARVMGQYLAWIQDARWEQPMRYNREDTLEPFEMPFGEWFVAQVREQLSASRKHSNATTDADVAWVEETIARTRGSLEVPFEPSIVHTDYAEGNVCAERGDDGGWRITGVFDLAQCYVGDGEYDLTRMGSWYGVRDPRLMRAFIDGYAAERPLRPGAGERLALYTLHDRLVHWEYGQRNKVWFREGMCLREWAEQFVVLDFV